MRILRTTNLIIAFIATTAPMAHALEMISKFKVDGPLWLGIQQQLYRGWGEVFGPVEILALLTTLALLLMRWRDRHMRSACLIAAFCFAAMLINFFVFNQPVNQAVNGWTTDTLPSNWSMYRTHWEVGHALTAVFSITAFVVLIRQHSIAERPSKKE